MLIIAIILIGLYAIVVPVTIKNYYVRRKWESELVDLICTISEAISTSLSKESPNPTSNSGG